jgi:hypothetical protein
LRTTRRNPRHASPSRRLALVLALALAVALAVALAPTAGFADPPRCDAQDAVQSSASVPTPTVTGPTSGGIRTGKPYGASLVPLDEGYVEEEFFFSGTARAVATNPADTAAYATRILVRRPADPARFNGTVVLDWTNVTIPDDTDVSWIPMHDTIMERGFVYVAVAAQRLAVEVSPLALKQWDPVRYGSLSHPGDDYSYDIFSQAAEAVLDAKVLGDLRPCVQRRLALGASQSAGRLRTYINVVAEQAGVFDGFSPQLSNSAGVRRDLAPVLWLNSQSEVGATGVEPDSERFRLWELAGPAHTTNEYNSYTNATIVNAHSNGNVNPYNHDDASAWGYRSGAGNCVTRNYFQAKYAFSASLVALDEWVRTGEAPAPMPRAARDASGRLYDEHGNLAGGIRSPLLEVPIATYFGGGVPSNTEPCGAVGGRIPLTGTTRVFDAAKLASLYASGEDYLRKFQAAIGAALDAGMLLPEGARDLRARANEAAAFVDAATS